MTLTTLALTHRTYDGVAFAPAAYGDGSLAIEAHVDGERLLTVTVKILGDEPVDGCVWVKSWSENAGLDDALVEAGLTERTGRVAQAGFAAVSEHRLTDRFRALLGI